MYILHIEVLSVFNCYTAETIVLLALEYVYVQSSFLLHIFLLFTTKHYTPI